MADGLDAADTTGHSWKSDCASRAGSARTEQRSKTATLAASKHSSRNRRSSAKIASCSGVAAAWAAANSADRCSRAANRRPRRLAHSRAVQDTPGSGWFATKSSHACSAMCRKRIARRTALRRLGKRTNAAANRFKPSSSALSAERCSLHSSGTTSPLASALTAFSVEWSAWAANSSLSASL